MNVKITSLLKVTSLVIVLAALFLTAFFYVPGRGNDIDCTTHFNIHFATEQGPLVAKLQLAVHLVPNERSNIAEYGEVMLGDNHYIVDRNVRLRYSDRNPHAYLEIEREGIDKNVRDTLPDVLTEKLSSSQKVLFLKIKELNTDIWRLEDLRRTVLICYAKN